MYKIKSEKASLNYVIFPDGCSQKNVDFRKNDF